MTANRKSRVASTAGRIHQRQIISCKFVPQSCEKYGEKVLGQSQKSLLNHAANQPVICPAFVPQTCPKSAQNSFKLGQNLESSTHACTLIISALQSVSQMSRNSAKSMVKKFWDKAKNPILTA